MSKENPILKAYLKQVADSKKRQLKLPKRRVMKKFSGSPCIPVNLCKCKHFARYHDNNETGECYYCKCTEFRVRPENEGKYIKYIPTSESK